MGPVELLEGIRLAAEQLPQRLVELLSQQPPTTSAGAARPRNAKRQSGTDTPRPPDALRATQRLGAALGGPFAQLSRTLGQVHELHGAVTGFRDLFRTPKAPGASSPGNPANVRPAASAPTAVASARSAAGTVRLTGPLPLPVRLVGPGGVTAPALPAPPNRPSLPPLPAAPAPLPGPASGQRPAPTLPPLISRPVRTPGAPPAPIPPAALGGRAWDAFRSLPPPVLPFPPLPTLPPAPTLPTASPRTATATGGLTPAPVSFQAPGQGGPLRDLLDGIEDLTDAIGKLIEQGKSTAKNTPIPAHAGSGSTAVRGSGMSGSLSALAGPGVAERVDRTISFARQLGTILKMGAEAAT